jgi:hypothetical protein
MASWHCKIGVKEISIGDLTTTKSKVGGLAQVRQAEDDRCGNSNAKKTDSIGEWGGCTQ